ncbi:hypothetical protein [Nostoc sp. 'Peltigera malacea cyanobiont' DB3992]|uniref:hypothetical protein n=1 Tax=Nostoc sp. 'Peltigera malacea cyanobiont' DB3992 TaxID=1206980 RepID=UPI00211E00C8|nr:hypothetical protein [Nostoc sp. 'Peltigera malacea cyanobiont' DB3992]
MERLLFMRVKVLKQIIQEYGTYVVYSCLVGQEEVVENPDINTLAPAQELRQLINTLW